MMCISVGHTVRYHQPLPHPDIAVNLLHCSNLPVLRCYIVIHRQKSTAPALNNAFAADKATSCHHCTAAATAMKDDQDEQGDSPPLSLMHLTNFLKHIMG
jgi:hypothetical protein